MTVEWMEYPLSIGSENEMMTITWSDGTTDEILAHDGDGETFYQLEVFMEEIFKIKNYNCSEGQSAKFSDEYPVLFKSPTGVLVLRVNSEENFLNAFVCKSKNPAECLLSWMDGDIGLCLSSEDYPSAGSNDFHWVSAKEVMAMIAAGLLDDVQPIVFDQDSYPGDKFDAQAYGLLEVESPWLLTPSEGETAFAFPACLFLPDSYKKIPSLATVDSTAVGISVTQRLDEDDWLYLLKSCLPGSIAENIVNQTDDYPLRFRQLRDIAIELIPMWLERWNNLY